MVATTIYNACNSISSTFFYIPNGSFNLTKTSYSKIKNPGLNLSATVETVNQVVLAIFGAAALVFSSLSLGVLGCPFKLAAFWLKSGYIKSESKKFYYEPALNQNNTNNRTKATSSSSSSSSINPTEHLYSYYDDETIIGSAIASKAAQPISNTALDDAESTINILPESASAQTEHADISSSVSTSKTSEQPSIASDTAKPFSNTALGGVGSTSNILPALTSAQTEDTLSESSTIASKVSQPFSNADLDAVESKTNVPLLASALTQPAYSNLSSSVSKASEQSSILNVSMEVSKDLSVNIVISPTAPALQQQATIVAGESDQNEIDVDAALPATRGANHHHKRTSSIRTITNEMCKAAKRELTKKNLVEHYVACIAEFTDIEAAKAELEILCTTNSAKGQILREEIIQATLEKAFPGAVLLRDKS